MVRKALTIDQAKKLIDEGKAKPIGYRRDRGAIIIILTPRRQIRYYR